jgi:anaerobic selenocysteine-containing dehydrogenase
MKKDKQQISESRRSFLKKAGIGASTAAASVAVPSVAMASPEDAEPEKKQKGYQLSQHILTYYKNASR